MICRLQIYLFLLILNNDDLLIALESVDLFKVKLGLFQNFTN